MCGEIKVNNKMVENKRKPYPKAKLFRKGYGFFYNIRRLVKVDSGYRCWNSRKFNRKRN